MYKAIDYTTNEKIIESDDFSRVNEAIKEWLKNNKDSLIEIFKDDKCIYP